MTEVISSPINSELLLDYVQTGSKQPFELIVKQNIHLVHAAAMRQVRDPHLAEDVTQAVFLLLWQRAESIATHNSLAGWLLVTTHHIARNALKKEWRLKQREQKVAQMTLEQNPSPPDHSDSILPLLDTAMAQLGDADRDAIVERFFHSRSLDQVGASLGVSQQAAAKRIGRAIEKLRGILARHGVRTSDAKLSLMLPAMAVKPCASSSLLSKVLAGPGGAVSANAASLASSALRPWATIITKTAIGSTALLGLGGIVYLAAVLHAAAPAQLPQLQLQAVAAMVQSPTVPDEPTITLSLVDAKTNAPIPGGEVEVDIDSEHGPSEPAEPNGKFVLPLVSVYKIIHVICRAPGRAAMCVEFQNYTFKGDPPAEYTIPMEPSARIGGIVTDDLGNPVEGAIVHLGAVETDNSDTPRPWTTEDATTDAEGKWHIDSAPATLGQNSYLQVRDDDDSRSYSTPDLPADQLHGGVYQTTLRAIEEKQIHGVVLDPDLGPVHGAHVVIATDHYLPDKPEAITDIVGKFTVAVPIAHEDTFATVTAKGFAPQQVKIPGAQNNKPTENTDSKPLQFVLSRSVPLQGTVVDTSGNPMKGATVEVEQWRGNRALDWSTKTDRNGMFIWKDAPAEPVLIDVFAKNRASLENINLTPGQAGIRLTMLPALKITGYVIDADTKAPIPAFRITYGVCSGTSPDEVGWQLQTSRKLGNGKYEADMDAFGNGGKLRVEADGYLPATSRVIKGDEGSIQINLEMKKGSGPNGTVLSPDGKPLPDVRVALEPQGWNINYPEPASPAAFHFNYPETVLTQTDKDGHFNLPAQDKKFSLLIVTDEGFALMRDDQLPKDGQIHLQKWARIEGDYRLNASPARFAKFGVCALLHDGYRSVSQINTPETTIDTDGHFVLDRIAPNALVVIDRAIPYPNGSKKYVRMGSFRTLAGQTLTVHFGGKGRPVIGKVLLPANVATPVDYVQVNGGAKSSDDPNTVFWRSLHYPEDYPDMTLDQQAQWYQAKLNTFLNNQPAAAAQVVLDKSVSFDVSPDGTMRADNVEPGTYQGQVTFQDKLMPNRNTVDLLGIAPLSFTIPATPVCPTDDPLDIGTIQLIAPATIEVGKPLPKVQLVTLDGQAIDPSTWAGKVAVLHLWDMHSRSLFPAIHQLAGKFNNNPHIQIVNLAVNFRPEWSRHIDAEDHLPGLLATPKDPEAEHGWMCQGLPFVLLLDSRGNLIEKLSDAKELPEAVEKAAAK